MITFDFNQPMLMRIAILTGLSSLLSLFTAAQTDTSTKKFVFSHQFEILGRQHYYDFYSRVSVPQPIKEVRRNATKLPIGFDTVTDNPFRHGAMYAAFKSRLSLRNKVTLNADLYGEYRGFSYGTYNLKNNLVVYPVLSIHALDTLTIGKTNWIVDGKVGQFLNEKTGEGWLIYNVDVQGTQARIRYGHHRIGFTIYGNLESSIGLNIDDLKDYSYEYLFRNDSARVGVSLTTAAPGFAPVRYHSYYSVFASLLTSRNTRWYMQGGFTNVFTNFPSERRRIPNTTGGVIGMEKKWHRKNIDWVNTLELRYYGSMVNLLHYQPGSFYRDSASNEIEMYANTTGEFLYPIRKFDTPFSQWAMFTEYVFRNVTAVSAVGKFQYHLSSKCSVLLDYDINLINAALEKTFAPKNTSFFIYPFFKTGLQYHPIPELRVAAFLTNKSMNLDLQYPTHYLHKKPFVGLEIYCKI